MADYEFVNNYCYANMADYNVNQATGEVDLGSKVNLRYMKLYPYALLCLTVLGAWTNISWEMTAHKRSAQAEYLVDGIDEAMGELISALRQISKLLNSEPSKAPTGLHPTIITTDPNNHQKLRLTLSSQSEVFDHQNGAAHKPSTTIVQANSLRKSSARRRMTTKNSTSGLSSVAIPEENETDFNCEEKRANSEHSIDELALLRKEVKDPAAQMNKEYSKKIKEEIEVIWARNQTKDKFIELEDLMESRAKSRNLMIVVFVNRFQTLFVTLFSAFIVFYLYLLQEHDLVGYNCLLPESHYYDVITSAGVFTWKTTNCYFKAIAVWTLMSMLLFIFYCAILILQLIFWYKNIESWRKSYKMVQYLPLQGASYLQNNALSDLHVLMAIINQNDQARKTISLVDKVLSSLEKNERVKFLPVLMEVIVWGATDEKVDDLVEKIIARSET